MLKNDEIKILKFLFDDLNNNPTMRNVSMSLKQKYPQTFKTIKNLEKNGFIILNEIGKSKVIHLNFSKDNLYYICVEIERTEDLCKKNMEMLIIKEKLKDCGNFVSLIFGSHAKNKNLKGSDIDLLIIIPDEKEVEITNKKIKNALSLYNIDLNIISEKSLFEMWENKRELNVGNEVLKNHYVLTGFETYINYLRKKYGR
ncbi:nucleotidyltransferase domain-containing protein [Candidatus Pacearchaeota archaeon]|nr:nucleotidyltransferase domain-containing protein [Candidatus Pacearchaeota archaeon]